MKWNKTYFNHIKCFISACGEYHVVNYGGKIKAYYKIDCINHITKKKYRQFGNSCEYDNLKNSISYKTYRKAFAAAERHKVATNES